MINSFNILRFRGIRDLEVKKLNKVNLIVGDNNCGKTSILEALLLLRNPGDFANIIQVARARDSFMSRSYLSTYDNFIYLFPRNEETLEINVSAVINNESTCCNICGKEYRVLIDKSEIDNRFLLKQVDEDFETNEFKGILEYRINDRKESKPIQFNFTNRIGGIVIDRNDINNIVYVAPSNHIWSNVFDSIVRSDDNYKDICIKVIQLFDSDIIDMVVLKSKYNNSPIQYLKHRKLGLMPLSTYGDGIKKVLMLANAIVKARNGALLIDEIETSIHKKYYDDVFAFLIKACDTFNVQLFITTHSIETLDGLLHTQDYEQSQSDAISVVTVKQINEKTYARVLTGQEVSVNRKAFGFEVRL